MANEFGHVFLYLNLDDLAHNMDDLGPSKFVDMHKFQFLVTCTASLE